MVEHDKQTYDYLNTINDSNLEDRNKFIKMNDVYNEDITYNKSISQLDDKYFFLDNNYITNVVCNNENFNSVNSAFYYCLTSNETTKKTLKASTSIFDINNIGKRILSSIDKTNLEDIEILYNKLIRDKFRRSRNLQKMLLETKFVDILYIFKEHNSFTELLISSENKYLGLVEKSEYNNKKGLKLTGDNKLGQIIMNIRNDLNENIKKEIFNWLKTSYNPLIIDNSSELKYYFPEIIIKVKYESNKEVVTLNKFFLDNSTFYFIGYSKDNQIIIDNNSVSRVHAIVYIDNKLGLCIIDLNSKRHTYINDDIILSNIPYKISNNSKIKLADFQTDLYFDINVNQTSKKLSCVKQLIEQQDKCIDILNKSINSSSYKDKNIDLLLKILNNQFDLKEDKIVLIKYVSYSLNLNQLLDYIDNKIGYIEDIKEQSVDRYVRNIYIKFKREKDAKYALDKRYLYFKDKKFTIENANIVSLKDINKDRRNVKRSRSGNSRNKEHKRSRYVKEKYISRSRSYSKNRKH